MGEEFKEHRLREVRAWCKANFGEELPVQPGTEYVNAANGLLYWEQDPPRLAPQSPAVPSIIQIPVEWSPDADCPRIFDFLACVVPEDCLQFILEWTGYLLIPTAKFQRALMLDGPGDTGKSTLELAMEIATIKADDCLQRYLQARLVPQSAEQLAALRQRARGWTRQGMVLGDVPDDF